MCEAIRDNIKTLVFCETPLGYDFPFRISEPTLGHGPIRDAWGCVSPSQRPLKASPHASSFTRILPPICQALIPELVDKPSM